MHSCNVCGFFFINFFFLILFLFFIIQNLLIENSTIAHKKSFKNSWFPNNFSSQFLFISINWISCKRKNDEQEQMFRIFYIFFQYLWKCLNENSGVNELQSRLECDSVLLGMKLLEWLGSNPIKKLTSINGHLRNFFF